MCKIQDIIDPIKKPIIVIAYVKVITMTPTLALALEDFVPVLLTLLALLWLTRMIFAMDRRSGYVAALGSLLVVLGGLFKATSKLLWVFSGELITWMENSLFTLMAPGFAFLAWAIWCGQRRVFGDTKTQYVFQVPMSFFLLIGAGTVFFNTSQQGRIWFFVLLTLVVLMSSLMLILLSRHAFHYRLKGAASLFLVYLVITLALNGMARTPSPSISVEWMKQIINTAASVILALASWKLWRGTKETS